MSAVALSIALALGGAMAASTPAQAGSTSNSYGCTGYWTSGGTAAWGSCYNTTKSVTIRLEVKCWGVFSDSWLALSWKNIGSGSTISPYDRYECTYEALDVAQGFKYTGDNRGGVAVWDATSMKWWTHAR